VRLNYLGQQVGRRRVARQVRIALATVIVDPVDLVVVPSLNEQLERFGIGGSLRHRLT